MNTAPKLQNIMRAIDGALTRLASRCTPDSIQADDVRELDRLIKSIAALAPPSGEGVGLTVADAWFESPTEITIHAKASCGAKLPEEGTKIYTTPQSAPVDVIGPDEVVVHREILENADAALSISNHKGSAWSEHESPRYEIRELLGLPYEKRTTPPPASQEREEKFRKAWYAVCNVLDEVSPGWLSINADVTATDLACTVIRELASPPSSVVEGPSVAELEREQVLAVRQGDYGDANAIDAEIDAAEQAKPDMADDDAFAAYIARLDQDELEAEHAQAGELRDSLSRLLQSTYEAGKRGRGWSNQAIELGDILGAVLTDRQSQGISHATARVMLDSLDDFARMDCGVDAKGPRETLEKYIDQQERRLAGGVTVDDAMVVRARDGQEAYWDDDALYVTCERCNGKGHHGGFGEGGHDQDWCETCGGPGSINIGTEVGAMRAALVAALGARNG